MKISITAAGLLVLGAGAAQAQGMPNCLGRPDFDACIMSMAQRGYNQSVAAQADMMRSYVAANTPRIQQEYAQYRQQGSPLSFEQFVMWRIQTQNGRDLGGAQRAQESWFRGQQGAQQTMEGAYEQQRRGMARNSDAAIGSVERYSREAIRGESPYADPRGGQVTLPNNLPAYRQYSWGGQTYQRDGQGNYFVLDGNRWVPMSNLSNR